MGVSDAKTSPAGAMTLRPRSALTPLMRSYKHGLFTPAVTV